MAEFAFRLTHERRGTQCRQRRASVSSLLSVSPSNWLYLFVRGRRFSFCSAFATRRIDGAVEHGCGVSYAALAQILGGTCVVTTRLIVNQVGPLSIAGIRYLIGFFCLLPFALLFKTRIDRKDWFAVFLLGALMFGFFPWAFSASTQYTTSFRAALVLSTTPLLTLLANTLFRFERMTIWKVLGSVLAFAGVLLALGESAVSSQPTHPWFGEAFMLSAGLAFVAHNVLARPYLQKYGSISVTAGETAAGVSCLLAVLFARGETNLLLSLNSTGWWGITYLGVVGGALLYFLWNRASNTRPLLWLQSRSA